MEQRPLGRTGADVSVVGLGKSGVAATLLLRDDPCTANPFRP